MSTTHAIQQVDRALAFPAAQDPATLSRDLTMLVQLNLNVDSIVALGETSRTWRNLTDDPQLWRYLLIRDFGQEFAENILDEDCKQKYIQMYESSKKFMGMILDNPNISEEKKQSLLEASREDQSIKLCGLISYKRFVEFLDELTIQDLGLVFCIATAQGLIPIIKLIMQRPNFNEIHADGLYGLGDAFGRAAANGKIAAMNLIMQSPRFSEIHIDGRYGLSDSFGWAVDRNQTAAIKLIIECPRFDEIPLEEGGKHNLQILLARIATMKQIVAEHLVK